MQVCQIFSQCADLVLFDEMSTKGIAQLTCCTALIITSYQLINQTVHRPIRSSMYGIVPPNILHHRQIHIRIDQIFNTGSSQRVLDVPSSDGKPSSSPGSAYPPLAFAPLVRLLMTLL